MPSRSALISAVIVLSLLLPAQAHDIYSHLVDRWGRSCCDDRDCRPVPYRFTATGLQMLVNGQWIDVPNHTILYRTLPDDPGETGGGHWCGFAHKSYESDVDPVYTTRCAILPPKSGVAPYGSEQFSLQ
jgi:hypothetical protein